MEVQDEKEEGEEEEEKEREKKEEEEGRLVEREEIQDGIGKTWGREQMD